MFGKRSIFRRIGTLALFFLIAQAISAQTDLDLPGWVLYEKGLTRYEEGKLAEALELITLSAGEGEMTPEAIYWTGRIYEAEGDYLLAEKRYEEALKKIRFLYIPEEKWNIHYSLSDIYLNRKDFDRYEQMLLSVFDEEMQRNSEIIRREHSYVQMLKSDGLDKLLLLFRLELSYSLEACLRLGRYYNGTEQWKSSLIKNLYTLMSSFTTGIELLILQDPDFSYPVDMEEVWDRDSEFLSALYEDFCRKKGINYSFSRDLNTLELQNPVENGREALALIRTKDPDFELNPAVYTLLKLEALNSGSNILDMDALYSSLYFTAEALYREGFPLRAKELWATLIRSGRDSSWKSLASAKLEDPELKTPFLKY